MLGYEVQRPVTRPACLSVSELTQKIRGALEADFLDVWVHGEISNFRPASSGHVYFSLKDSGASLSAAIFGWGKKRLPLELKEGLEVVCSGRLSVYPPRGSYQLVVDRIEPLGAGALLLAFEQLKEKLAREGLFETSRKRVIPKFPKKIGVVTSPTGAVIQDMTQILKRRAPFIEIVVIPSLVQGPEAPAQLIRGLQAAQRLAGMDMIVMARGGGSVEDLACFNDEQLARAIAGSSLPVISAVGHETDTTLVDWVADLRAPTPSAAAEILSAGWVEAGELLIQLRQRLYQAMERVLRVSHLTLDAVASRLISPQDRLRDQSQRCDEWGLRLRRAMEAVLESHQFHLGRMAAQFDALSPLRVLGRGYALVRDSEHRRVVFSSTQVTEGQKLEILFQDGTILAQVLESASSST